MACVNVIISARLSRYSLNPNAVIPRPFNHIDVTLDVVSVMTPSLFKDLFDNLTLLYFSL